MASYIKTKNTKRFSFIVDKNDTAKQAGSNTVTIATQESGGGQYSVGQSSLTMTVREANALKNFLNNTLV